MMLGKTKGNMYKWVDETRNFIGGRCPHKCKYCYVLNSRFKIVRDRYSGKPHLFEKEFKKPLGKGKTIFIGSCIDMWADEIPYEWIKKVLDYCKKFDNKYLFQSKNPERFLEFVFPPKTVLGTTVETNDVVKYHEFSKAPLPSWRLSAMEKLPKEIEKIISIEPIIDFIDDTFHIWIKGVNPKFVSIGADSKGHNLPEPSKEKVEKLIKELKKFTEVKIKDNLKKRYLLP